MGRQIRAVTIKDGNDMEGGLKRILILGGTAEANGLVRALADLPAPRPHVVLSLAGRTRDPILPKAAELRVGGFGGVEGLVAYCLEQRIDRLVDATHPFASQMAANAAMAARRAALVAIKLLRPPWEPRPGDRWRGFEDETAAIGALPLRARPFLALGRQHLSPLALRPDLRPVVRMIEPLADRIHPAAEVVLARPSKTPEEEAALFQRHGITHLVCRNAGGLASYPKIEAARRLALPVMMIVRPLAPEGMEIAPSPEAILKRLLPALA